jgi:tRNA threonylcarbamoyl adenosine modification protein YjeE
VDIVGTHESRSEADTQELGAAFAACLRPGDVVLLFGELGAGKTTLVRGILQFLGHQGVVRSPTFNLVQPFETDPPVMHADLYRVESATGLGIEDYLDSHVCLIEWAERAKELIEPDSAWTVRFEFANDGRRITIEAPVDAQARAARPK